MQLEDKTNIHSTAASENKQMLTKLVESCKQLIVCLGNAAPLPSDMVSLVECTQAEGKLEVADMDKFQTPTSSEVNRAARTEAEVNRFPELGTSGTTEGLQTLCRRAGCLIAVAMRALLNHASQAHMQGDHIPGCKDFTVRQEGLNIGLVVASIHNIGTVRVINLVTLGESTGTIDDKKIT